MKKTVLITGLLLLAIVMVSGCTSNDNNTKQGYNVTISNATILATFNEQKALNAIKPSADDAKLGFNVTDYGTKTIAGTKIFYSEYIDKDNNNEVHGDIYFEKNGKWHEILWKDVSGNPNKAAIDKEISDKINSI